MPIQIGLKFLKPGGNARREPALRAALFVGHGEDAIPS